MDGLVLIVEVVDGVDEPLAEEDAPHAVDDGLGKLRVVEDEAGPVPRGGGAVIRRQRRAVLLLADGQELGLGRRDDAVALLEEDDAVPLALSLSLRVSLP